MMEASPLAFRTLEAILDPLESMLDLPFEVEGTRDCVEPQRVRETKWVGICVKVGPRSCGARYVDEAQRIRPGVATRSGLIPTVDVVVRPSARGRLIPRSFLPLLRQPQVDSVLPGPGAGLIVVAEGFEAALRLLH